MLKKTQVLHIVIFVPLQQQVQPGIDKHDKQEQHQRYGKERLLLQAGGIGHLAGHCRGQKAHALK